MRASIKNLITAAVALTIASAAGICGEPTVTFYTCVGGASGMIGQLNPFATEGVVRGCAPQIMDECLKCQDPILPCTGQPKYAYSAARMKCFDNPCWSEPNADDPNWKPGQVKFTGDKSACEVAYLKMSNGNFVYAITIRADSVIGIRFVCNKQRIYAFTTLRSGYDTFVNAAKQSVTNPASPGYDPDFVNYILPDINRRLANGIPIEGGLAECYIDSAVRAIDKYNSMFPPPPGGIAQPQINPAGFPNGSNPTKDNIAAIAVLAVIYNKYIQQAWNGDQPINLNIQQLKMITGGMVDSWDAFFSTIPAGTPDSQKRLFNYYREPLSGTNITYLMEVMRGIEPRPNGSVCDDYFDFTTNSWVLGGTNVCPSDGVNYHRSGIPGLTCVADPRLPAGDPRNCPDARPGTGAMISAVNLNYGGIGFTFLQRFTSPSGGVPAGYENIRVAKICGAEPYPFDSGAPGDQNSLPGINGAREVTSPPAGKSFYQSVIDGQYPLWTYNHIFDATNGASANLQDFVNRFQLVANAPIVRSVGLLPLSDMETFASYRSIPTSGPNAGRGKGFGRCGFVSPLTGEIVRDGMTYVLNDPNAPDRLPGEGYVDNRP